MKLTIAFDQEKENTVSPEEQAIIENYIEKYPEDNEYENYITNTISEPEMYYLTTQSQNIINWYPFEPTGTILEIGGNLGERTGFLCKKAKQVVTLEPNRKKAEAIAKRHKTEGNLEIIVGQVSQISFNQKFDTILMIGILERIQEIGGEITDLATLLTHLKSYLTEKGKILLAVDNKFGLRFFAGNPENNKNKKFESLIGYANEPQKIETFTQKELSEIIKQLGLMANFYYPLPDYRMPNVIFSQKQLPQFNSVDKYVPYPKENSSILMNEVDVFREILKTDEEMFPFFANSFFVEMSKEPTEIQYRYVSFNNLRKESYRLITKIADTYVEKQPVDQNALGHYETIQNNLSLLRKNEIKTVDYVSEGKVQSTYQKQEDLLNNVLTKALEEKRTEEFHQIIEQYQKQIQKNSIKIENYEETIFANYNLPIENPEIIQNLHFLPQGLWDMTFKNCFYLEGELYFFDQEWVEENIPAEYILYRSILYTISLRRYINIEDLFEKYGLTPYRTLFEELDNKLQEKIRDQKIWEFYSQNKFIDIDATLQELGNMRIRDEAKQKAMENLEQENQTLRQEKDMLAQENEQLKQRENDRFSTKVKRKMNQILGGTHGENN